MRYVVREATRSANEYNEWEFTAKSDAVNKLSEVISENERQGRRLVAAYEFNATADKAIQKEMFVAVMDEEG